MSRWRSILIVPVVACLAATGLVVAAAGPAVAGTASVPAQAAGRCWPAGGAAVPDAAAPAASGIIVQGHGWGHGLGMSQYGARGAALLGCTRAQILSTYYAGTHLARRTMTAPVVLALRSGAARTTVLAESGAVAWTTPAGTRRVQPAGQTWTAQALNRGGRPGTGLLDAAGRLQVWISAGTLTAAHPGVTVRARSFTAASVKVSSDKRLRWGTLRFTRAAAGLTVEEVIASDSRGTSVDKYLWGLGEVPVSWPTQALQAQADAARTYLAGAFSSGAYRIVTTTAAQVYAGAGREDEDAAYGHRWRAAVNATRGEMVVDARSVPITAMYSSSDGGRSESRAYVYGKQGAYGYLSSVDDSRWDLASNNPYRSWAKAFTPADFAAALGFDSVSAVSLAAPGTTARQDGLKVTGVMDGVTRTAAFTGAAVRSALGLRSPAFTVTWLQPAPTGQTALAVQPLVGDWDGDGKDSVGLYRGGVWSLRNVLSAGPADLTLRYGLAGDVAT
jgi:SpoIID/LytB domain protein